ncbi:endothelial zinc finger protein induced by tumor necrosis factor alpha-like [Mercenaria mercenaria]|uniref:endothelial zinc finger protein induced by tumor necrosis factor alpha-like n=1 Tax=Mercenaria mercenaria TaxID=6596 RepID=UPI00234E8C2D|nr:endothelial zinc finger protein induced by tumor necrosis factor alpha-like [Mercenaria mercenaria]
MNNEQGKSRSKNAAPPQTTTSAGMSTTYLGRHKARRHQGPKSYACANCGKSFATQYEAKAHERWEESPAMPKSDACGMYFPRQFQLQEHLATHSSEHKMMLQIDKSHPYSCRCETLDLAD